MPKTLTPCQRRCQDCVNLTIENGVWHCAECFGQLVEDIDDCPEGVTLDAIETAEQKAKDSGVKTVARSDKPTERKPRERKPDIEKEGLIQKTADFLTELAENVVITNVSKVIEFDIGGNHYKFDLIRQRKPKNK